jgi:mono/diheme cytochrome c family protein
MRLKTLGVFVVTILALFTAFYWITDTGRREARAQTQEEALIEYGLEMFGPPSEEVPFTANCAQCHGPEGRGGAVGDTGVQAPDLHSRRIYDKLQVNEHYVELVIRFGGVVVSGNVESLMPAWSQEVGRSLNPQQIEALEALVVSWAEETGEAEEPEGTPVPDTVEAGREVFLTGSSPPCASCHGQDLAGVEGQYPSLQNIGSEPVTDLPTPVSQLDQLEADYEADPRAFLERWIRDSAASYNDGQATGMPAYPEESLPDDALKALITFLLEQRQ